MSLTSAVRGVNTRRINRANDDSLVIAFNYHAPRSEAGESNQRVVCKVEAGSLTMNNYGVRYFTARNIKRVDGSDEGIRTYRVDRITSKVEIV